MSGKSYLALVGYPFSWVAFPLSLWLYYNTFSVICQYFFETFFKKFLAPSGLHTFLTHCVSNHFGEYPFAFALLFLIADIKRNSAGIGLLKTSFRTYVVSILYHKPFDLSIPFLKIFSSRRSFPSRAILELTFTVPTSSVAP